MILDSTFFIDLLKDDEDARRKLEELIDSSTPVAYSPLTLFEVSVGLPEGKKRRFESVVTSMPAAPVGVSESRRAVEIQRELYDRGEPIGVIDVLIAGTAAEQSDETVLTRNVAEFERVDAIDVMTY